MENFPKQPLLITEKGLVLILKKKELTPSSGNIAYFLDRNQTRYELNRPGVWPINDSFFYPFSGKEVELSGEEYQPGKIHVQELKIIGEGYLMEKNEHLLPKDFEAIEGIPDMKLTETLTLQVVKNSSSPFDSEPTRLFLKIRVHHLLEFYVRVSMQQLDLFFQQRISLEELIRLREDELIYVDTHTENSIKEAVSYSRLKDRISSMNWGKLTYPSGARETADMILGELKRLTQNGIIGIYKDVI